MDIPPNECIYSILLFLNPKHLHLCGQINNNFYELCQLDSLWKDQIEDKYNELFKKENHYENCKMYYRLNVLRKNLYTIDHTMNYTIDRVYKIGSLRLVSSQLTQIPKELGVLPDLQFLDMSNNRLTQLSQELGQLTNLLYLYLGCNQLTQLPKEIGQLTDLRSLYLNYNQLTELPKEMSHLTNLETLNIAENKFTQKPKVIKQLHNLKKIWY